MQSSVRPSLLGRHVGSTWHELAVVLVSFEGNPSCRLETWGAGICAWWGGDQAFLPWASTRSRSQVSAGSSGSSLDVGAGLSLTFLESSVSLGKQ